MNNLSRYPEDDETKYLPNLDLYQQLRQIYSYERVEEHNEFREFVKFADYLNECANQITDPKSKLMEHYCSSFFNEFLLEHI